MQGLWRALVGLFSFVLAEKRVPSKKHRPEMRRASEQSLQQKTSSLSCADRGGPAHERVCVVLGWTKSFSFLVEKRRGREDAGKKIALAEAVEETSKI